MIPAALALLVLVAACGGNSSAPNPLVEIPATTLSPTATPSAAPTPLATEPVAISTIIPTAAPTAVLTGAPTTTVAFYKPAGWDGVSDLDCGDFDTHAHAQSFFVGTGGTTSNDPYRLDQNHDGNACESLP